MSVSAYIVLLRGVNVGGSNRLPMKDLARVVTACGGEEVRTYIQSGNVVLRAEAKLAKSLEDILQAALLEEFGFQVPVVLRSASALRRVLEQNPYTLAGVPEEKQLVLFLKHAPTEVAVASLDANRYAPDRFEFLGQEIYVHLGHGMCKSKLTNAYFDTRLKTISTGRNLRTLRKLVEMAAS